MLSKQCSGIDLSAKKHDIPGKQIKNLLLYILKIFLHLKAITQHTTSNKKKYLRPDLGVQKSEESNIAYTLIMNVHTETF